MYKLDWSLFDSNGSKLFRYDKNNQQIEFYKQITFQESVYTTKIKNLTNINLSSGKEVK